MPGLCAKGPTDSSQTDSSEAVLGVLTKESSRTAVAEKRQLSSRDHDYGLQVVEKRSPKEVPAGWKGKAASKAAYAQYGASHGLDKRFPFGDKNNGKEEDRSDQNGNGKGQKGVGGDKDCENEPPKEKDESVGDFSTSDEEDLDAFGDDEQDIFGGSKSLVHSTDQIELRS